MGSESALISIMHKYEAVIWDWNGTLLNDVEIAVETIGEVLSHHKLPKLSVDEYKKIFGFPVYNYYERLGFDFEQTPFQMVADHFIEVYNQRVTAAELFSDVIDVLALNKKMGRSQFILSAGHQNHLDEIVRHYDVHHYFDQVYGIDNHYAGSKVDRGRDLLRDHPIDPNKTVLIGDTDHDLEVGKALGVDVFLIADGHQSHDRLESKWHQVIETRFLKARESV